MKRNVLTLLALVIVGVLALTACGGSDDSSGGNATPATETGQTEAGAGEGVAIDVSSPAADLRITLDRLLAEHGELAVFAMQKGYDGSKDFKPIAAALEANTTDLGAAIGSVYGDEAEQAFLELWRDHIGFFVDYTVATAEKDKAAQQTALDKLAGYKVEFSQFLADATGLEADALAEGLQMHVDQLTGALDAYAAGDYDKAYANVREAYDHLTMVGDTLSGAISEQSPDTFPLEPATQPAVDLRVTLDKLLGEHATVAIFAMQKGYDGAKDFEQIAASLDENTTDLGAAIGSVYGDEAEQAFLELWRDHIGFFVDYTVATAENDEQGRTAALDKLAGYKVEFSQFLADATGLEADALAEGLQMHVDQLTKALDEYAAGNFEAAYATEREAYEHMFMTGDALAGAIVQQSPDEFRN